LGLQLVRPVGYRRVDYRQHRRLQDRHASEGEGR